MHTLNEQVKVFPAAEAAVTASAIMDFLAEEFGWIHSGDYLYLNEKRSVGFYFKLSTYMLSVAPFNTMVSGSMTGQNINEVEVIVRYHASTLGNTIYVNIGDKYAIIAAKDANENWYAISGVTSGNYFAIVGEISTAVATANFPGIVSVENYYAITKMPSILYGGGFPELFGVVSVKSFNFLNDLINFNGVTYRIVGLKYNEPPQFAFPVSD